MHLGQFPAFPLGSKPVVKNDAKFFAAVALARDSYKAVWLLCFQDAGEDKEY
jgi:hypothetical protein